MFSWGNFRCFSERKIQKLVREMTPSPSFSFFFGPGDKRNVSFHKSELKEDNINFQFIFCLSQKSDHNGNAVKTHEPEYMSV